MSWSLSAAPDSAPSWELFFAAAELGKYLGSQAPPDSSPPHRGRIQIRDNLIPEFLSFPEVAGARAKEGP